MQLITGGKGPPSTGEDWLSKLAPGTMFLAKTKSPRSAEETYSTVLFAKVGCTAKAVILETAAAQHRLYVDPTGFCNHWREYEILDLLSPKQEDQDERDRVQPEPSSPGTDVE